MGDFWFWLTGLMVVGWAVLDGFDFGVGMLHRYVARTDTERRQVLAAIGPVWDGNEVWLLAAGGTLFLAFPRLLAAGLSGLYLPVIFLIWALMGRAASIELRSHLPGALWRTFFDTLFVLASFTVPLLAGAALGNVVRGVPLDRDGMFSLPLFASLSPWGELGVLDWYTLTVAALVVVTLAAHGANYLVWKTDGAVQGRARQAQRLWWVVAGLWILATVATFQVAPHLAQAVPSRPFAWLGIALTVGGITAVFITRRFGQELPTFVASSVFIAGILVATVGALHPILLLDRSGEGRTLTVDNAIEPSAGQATTWWIPAFLLAVGYFVWVMRTFRGKAVAAGDGEGY